MGCVYIIIFIMYQYINFKLTILPQLIFYFYYLFQDNCQFNFCRLAMEFYATSHIRNVPHPAMLPDLIPAEPIFSHMVSTTHREFQGPLNAESLAKQVIDTCYLIPDEYCKTLAHSMCRRMRTVARVVGRHTRYQCAPSRGLIC